jgi:hypothetical protein
MLGKYSYLERIKYVSNFLRYILKKYTYYDGLGTGREDLKYIQNFGEETLQKAAALKTKIEIRG